MRVDMYFKINLEVEDNTDDLGEDLAAFIEDFLEGEDRVDVSYIGKL